LQKKDVVMPFNSGEQQPKKWEIWIQFLLQPEIIPAATTQLTLESSWATLAAGFLRDVKLL